MMPEVQHVEAFCLMKYRCKQGHEETIWNSRDGVTPFIVGCRVCGAEAQHVNWREDVCNPTHQPKPGERMFVTTTPEDAEQIAKRMVEQYWDHPDYPMSGTFPDKETAVERLAPGHVGQPRIVTMGGEPPINTTHGPDGRRVRFA